mgnify:CR=1 FL=1
MKVVTVRLEEAERALRAARSAYSRSKLEVVKVHALKDEQGGIHGVAIWGRLDETTAKRVHIWTDGSPMGWTMLYGNGCRALGSDGFTTIVLL